MEDKDIFFDYVDTDGTLKKAEVLTLFNVEGYDKTYAMCSIPSIDGNYEITAFIVNDKNPDGSISFDDIVDQTELSVVTKSVNGIVR